jgi:uncharacterized protein
MAVFKVADAAEGGKMSGILGKLADRVRPRYDGNGDPGHDFAHVERVLATCRRLGEELGADLDVLLPAALLHDVINVPKNHPDRLRASELAAAEARGMLADAGYGEGTIARIAQAIVEHSYSRGMKPSSLEAAILQDADKLDAIGALGVLRLVACGTRMGSRFLDPADPFARKREPDDKRYMVDHFFAKLLKLEGMMNTEPARAEARRRTETMRGFLAELERELSAAQ